MRRLDTNIYQDDDGGFRVYTRVPDPVTGKSKKVARRFPRTTSIRDLRRYRNTHSTPRRHPEQCFRVRYDVRGGHIHCHVFDRRAAGETWAKNGDLVFTSESWPAFRDLLQIAGIDVLPG